MNEGPLSPNETRDLLARLSHMPKKWLGQNFLIDGNIVRKSLELGEVKAGDTVVEVGPGLGTLTRTLLCAGADLYAIEADRTMHFHLTESLLPRFPQTFHLKWAKVQRALVYIRQSSCIEVQCKYNNRKLLNSPYS